MGFLRPCGSCRYGQGADDGRVAFVRAEAVGEATRGVALTRRRMAPEAKPDPKATSSSRCDPFAAVPQQHARAAIGPVRNVRETVDADDQRHDVAPVAQVLDQGLVVRRLERVDEARAAGGDVGGRGVGRAERLLDLRGEAGEAQPGVDAVLDVADLPGLHARIGQGIARRPRRHVEDRFVPAQDPARADAGPALDPRVARVDHLGQVVVGQHALGQVRAEAGEGHVRQGVRHGGVLSFRAVAGGRKIGSPGTPRGVTLHGTGGRPSVVRVARPQCLRRVKPR